MKDEYGKMNSDGETALTSNFKLESGYVLPKVETRYRTWGTLNSQGTNAIVVMQALTGNAAADTWWGWGIGPGKPFDTSKYWVFCANVLGSCYGTTGPATIDPETGSRQGSRFPQVTIRDMVQLQLDALRQLGVREVVTVAGGSMGGMLALEMGYIAKEPHVRSIMSFSSSGRHQPWQIGISECQRQSIYADPRWKAGLYHQNEPPRDGLAVARMQAMLTYRTHPAYWTKFGRDAVAQGDDRKGRDGSHDGTFEVTQYLRVQGSKFNERGFDAGAYVRLTEAMDSHDMARDRGDYYEVLRSIKKPVLIASISSDVLYPVSEQLELAQYIPEAQHHMIESDEGHDGFLLEGQKVGLLIRGFLGQMQHEAPLHRGPLTQSLLTAAKL